ncbi:MAG: BamA/TamA family outer membrane protein [Chitinophagaceae bacterium]|nr:BamA/TamA family outer membrane protein [Chitinophagaceae bacterium]
MIWKKENKKNINSFRINGELSGLITRLVKSDFLDSNLFRFLKVDMEFARKITFKKSALVLRVFGGIGYAFNSTIDTNKRYSLPLFRQYFAGGPNSMRAWALRKLGPGSFIKDFSNTSTGSLNDMEMYNWRQILNIVSPGSGSPA